MKYTYKNFYLMVFIFLLQGCSLFRPSLPSHKNSLDFPKNSQSYNYKIAPGDILKIYVWGNSELSINTIVRPDGKISMPLITSIDAMNKTAMELSSDIASNLTTYIRDPKVTISIAKFSGTYSEQIKIIGESVQPKAINYSKNMTLLDAMIQIGGLSNFAAGNKARLIRYENGLKKVYSLKIKSLLNKGNLKANVDLLPGDIIIIPESWL